jgi:hypothetical protein
MKLEHKKYSLVATEEQPNFSLELLSSTLLTKELLDSSTKTSIKLSVQRDTNVQEPYKTNRYVVVIRREG